MERREWTVGRAGSGVEIGVVHHGRSGAPLVYVPTSAGDRFELERYGMDRDLAPWIENGKIQVLSIDGHGPTTLFSDELPRPARMPAYARFERALVDELAVEVARLAGSPRFLWVGASYGAFVVANVFLKRPDRVEAACGLGGVYGLWHRHEGCADATSRAHTPLDYVTKIDVPTRLEAIRRTGGMRLYAGSRDEWRDSTDRFASGLAERCLPHEVRWWHDADHHEHWWRRQLLELVHDRFGTP
jgi:esterase/lipase superfamily enzyme